MLKSPSNPFGLLLRLKKAASQVPSSSIETTLNCFETLSEPIWLIIIYQWPLLLHDGKGLGERLMASWWKRYLLAFWLQVIKRQAQEKQVSQSPGKEDADSLAWSYLRTHGDLSGILVASNNDSSRSISSTTPVSASPALSPQVKAKVNKEHSLNMVFFKLANRDLMNAGFSAKFNISSSKNDYLEALEFLLSQYSQASGKVSGSANSNNVILNPLVGKGSGMASPSARISRRLQTTDRIHTDTPSSMSSVTAATPLPGISKSSFNFDHQPMTSKPFADGDSKKVSRYKAMVFQLHRHVAASEQEYLFLQSQCEKVQEQLNALAHMISETANSSGSVSLKKVRKMQSIIDTALTESTSRKFDSTIIPDHLTRAWSKRGSLCLKDLWQEPKEFVDATRLHALEDCLARFYVKLTKFKIDSLTSDPSLEQECGDLWDLISSLALLFPIKPSSSSRSNILEKDHPDVVNLIIDHLMAGKISAADAKIKLCQIFAAQRLRHDQEKREILEKK